MAHRFDAMDARASRRPRATTAGTPTVLVVDDDELVLRTLRRLLGQAGFHVEACSSLGDLLRSPHCGGPGCLVLDLHLPGLSGIELYQLLHEAGCRMPTVFLTGRGDVAASVSAMKLGAVDFLTKPVDDADLIDAIRAALARDEAARRELAERRELERGAATLTPREAQVWSLVVTGLHNREVAARLGTCEKTVKVHRARVMEKLGAGSFADLVRMHLMLRSSSTVALDAASTAAPGAGRGTMWPPSSAAAE